MGGGLWRTDCVEVQVQQPPVSSFSTCFAQKTLKKPQRTPCWLICNALFDGLNGQTVGSLCSLQACIAVRVHISIVPALYQPEHLPPPPPLFPKQCLLDVYLHGSPNTGEGKGKWEEGQLCKSWPVVESSERVKQIYHEMASRPAHRDVSPSFKILWLCTQRLLNCFWVKLCWIYGPLWMFSRFRITNRDLKAEIKEAMPLLTSV